MCSFLNDSRKTEAGNYNITALAVASGKYPINILAAEQAQSCWENTTCWPESFTNFSELIIKCLTVSSQAWIARVDPAHAHGLRLGWGNTEERVINHLKRAAAFGCGRENPTATLHAKGDTCLLWAPPLLVQVNKIHKTSKSKQLNKNKSSFAESAEYWKLTGIPCYSLWAQSEPTSGFWEVNRKPPIPPSSTHYSCLRPQSKVHLTVKKGPEQVYAAGRVEGAAH